MSKHLLGAHMSTSGGLFKAFERGADVGCDTIQIFNKNNNQWHARPLADEDVKKFKNAQSESGIKPVVCHASYLTNLASPDTAALKRSREAFLIEMQRCELLEIPYLVMHPGSHLGKGIDEGIETIAESFNWLHQQTDNFNLMLLLETTAGQGTNIGFTFQQLKDIIGKTSAGDRLGVCLDTCHVFAAGYNIAEEEGYNNMWQEFDEIIGIDQLKAIHMNDSKKDLGSRVDRHDHIGAGEIGLDAFSFLVNDSRLVGIPMILETPKGKDYAEDRENLAILRGLIRT